MNDMPGKWRIKTVRWEDGYLIRSHLYYDNLEQAWEELKNQGRPLDSCDFPEFVTVFGLIREPGK